MKNKILNLCFLILFGAACKEQPFELDDIILQCYEPNYQQEGYDITTIIDDYQKVLVREGVLKDVSGKSYLEVLQRIHSDKDFRIQAPTFQETDPLFKVGNETKLAVFKCEKEMIEAAKEQDPKWHKVFGNPGSPRAGESPEPMCRAMVENLSEKEVNSYYFRLKMFQVFDGVNSKWGNQSLAPPISTE